MIDRLLSVESLNDIIIGTDAGDEPDAATHIVMAKQLLDTMRDNRRLREAMQEIIDWEGMITDATLRNFVRDALSNKY